MEIKKEGEEVTVPKMRQIIISTDGTNILLEKAEVSGLIELNAILSMILKEINTPKDKKTNTEPNPVPPHELKESI